jgi:hypothetical protein
LVWLVCPTCCTNLLYQHVWQTNESSIAVFIPTPKLVWNVGPTSWHKTFQQNCPTKLVQHVGPTFHSEFIPKAPSAKGNFFM